MLTEKEINEIYNKSIWDMTPNELYENNLVHTWVNLVDQVSEEED